VIFILRAIFFLIIFGISIPKFFGLTENVPFKLILLLVLLNKTGKESSLEIPRMVSFPFKVALMQEHFNENYMDSDIYPKAIFRGKIESFDFEKLSSDETYTLKGKLTIRGISKELSFPVLLSKTNKRINLKGTFSVNPKNFGIEIPNIIRKKIARKINITINYELSKKE
jgi:hypothetical protein